MKWASRRSIASAKMPKRMETKPAHKSMGLGCLAALPLSTGQRAPANIGAEKRALPMDFLHGRISAALRLGDGGTGGGDIQHPAADGHDAGTAPFRPGMKQG